MEEDSSMVIVPLEKDYSEMGHASIILFYAAVIVVILLVPIITGVSLGVPNKQNKFGI